MNFQHYFSNPGMSLAYPLQLYRASLKTGEILIYLKQAFITPIYMGGYRNLLRNNHPVALTSPLIKILEKILAQNIHQFLEMH